MNPVRAILKQARDETRVSDALPFTHLRSPTVFCCKSGMPGMCIRVDGAPFVTEGNTVLNRLANQWHHAIASTDERFIQYVTIHRHKEPLSLEGTFPSDFADQVNTQYQKRFVNRALFRNDIYLTTLLKGDDSTHTAKGLALLNRLDDFLNPADTQKTRREKDMVLLESRIQHMKSLLSPFSPYILGERDEERGASELLQFLSLFPNAQILANFSPPLFASPIARDIPGTHKAESLYPEGHLGQYLCAKRIIFGDYIQFQGAHPKDCRFGAILSVKKYSRETAHTILDPLLTLDAEFIATHSFAPLPRDRALLEIARKRGKLINAEDLGTSQIAELSDLEDDIASENALLGYHHNTLLLLADSVEELDNHILDATKAYACSGTVVVRETLGAEPAFFAQIPGNHHFITRASLITSRNFTDFCALHNFETGFRDENHLGSAVTILETPSRTPVYFNYHTKGALTNPSPGHTAIFGANNAGKNTLVAFMDAQMGRYHNRSFFLDRNEASKIYVLASGGRYVVVSPNHCAHMRINPFRLPDTAENRMFLKSFMAELVKRHDERDIPADVAVLLNECVNYAYDSLDAKWRQLTHVAKHLPRDFARMPELSRFLRADGLREEGEFAWLFDNEDDTLTFDGDKVGFDVTWLMDEASPLVATPLYMLLLHRMRSSMDGRLTSFIIDEAWQVFGSPFWERALAAWVPTIRKLNGHFIFMTQSPETILHSPIAPIIFANVVTTVCFPNSDADEGTYCKGLGLSESEFAMVRDTHPASRQFLYRQRGEGSILCKLDLGDMPECVRVFSANKHTVSLCDAVMAELGDDPAVWLPVFFQRSAS